MDTFVFPTTRAEDVCSAMETIMDDESYDTSGLMMVAAPPSNNKPVIIVAARCTGTHDTAKEAYAVLHDLKPLVETISAVPIQNVGDGRAALATKGEYKQFGIAGLQDFQTTSFVKAVALFEEMVTRYPETIKSTFNFQ